MKEFLWARWSIYRILWVTKNLTILVFQACQLSICQLSMLLFCICIITTSQRGTMCEIEWVITLQITFELHNPNMHVLLLSSSPYKLLKCHHFTIQKVPIFTLQYFFTHTIFFKLFKHIVMTIITVNIPSLASKRCTTLYTLAIALKTNTVISSVSRLCYLLNTTISATNITTITCFNGETIELVMILNTNTTRGRCFTLFWITFWQNTRWQLIFSAFMFNTHFFWAKINFWRYFAKKWHAQYCWHITI